jgi:hypothetical protein
MVLHLDMVTERKTLMSLPGTEPRSLAARQFTDAFIMAAIYFLFY